MRVAWDPHPTFIRLPAWPVDPTPADIAAYNQHLWDLYASYADSLDQDYPAWYLEILCVSHPPSQLVAMAQQRRDREVK